MHINEARCDNPARCVDFFGAFACDFAHGSNPATFYRKIALEWH